MNSQQPSSPQSKTKWILLGSLALTAGALGVGFWLKHHSSEPVASHVSAPESQSVDEKSKSAPVAEVSASEKEAAQKSQAPSNPEASSAKKNGGSASEPVSTTVSKTETSSPASCFEISFESDKKDLSAYSRNLIRLPVSAFNAKSVCIKVNGTPVKFISSKEKKNEFIIGAMTRSNSKVSVRYCEEGAQCKESCVVPKDEFIEALAGEENLSRSEHVAQGFGDTETDQKVERELAAFKDDLNGADHEKGQFYADWKNTASVPACVTRVASK